MKVWLIHVHKKKSFLETVFADGCGPFQQDNTHCRKQKLNWASVRCAGQTSTIHGGSTLQLAGLKGSAAEILMPDTTAKATRGPKQY